MKLSAYIKRHKKSKHTSGHHQLFAKLLKASGIVVGNHPFFDEMAKLLFSDFPATPESTDHKTSTEQHTTYTNNFTSATYHHPVFINLYRQKLLKKNTRPLYKHLQNPASLTSTHISIRDIRHTTVSTQRKPEDIINMKSTTIQQYKRAGRSFNRPIAHNYHPHPAVSKPSTTFPSLQKYMPNGGRRAEGIAKKSTPYTPDGLTGIINSNNKRNQNRKKLKNLTRTSNKMAIYTDAAYPYGRINAGHHTGVHIKHRQTSRITNSRHLAALNNPQNREWKMSADTITTPSDRKVNINLNISKFQDSINIHTTQLHESTTEIERKITQTFVNILEDAKKIGRSH